MANLLLTLRLFVTELVIREEITVDFDAFKEEEEIALALIVTSSSMNAVSSIQKKGA